MTTPDDIPIKATAILAGQLADQVRRKCASGRMDEAAQEFAELLSALTSRDAPARKAAKTRVNELARLGQWKPSVGSAKAGTAANGDPTLPVKKRSGTWSDMDVAMILGSWNEPDAPRNAEHVRSLCELMGRSPLALIIRLYQHDAITLDAGDALCRETGATRLLSEANLAFSPP